VRTVKLSQQKQFLYKKYTHINILYKFYETKIHTVT